MLLEGKHQRYAVEVRHLLLRTMVASDDQVVLRSLLRVLGIRLGTRPIPRILIQIFQGAVLI